MTSPLSRRTVIAAGAWSAPVIVLSAAVPARATSAAPGAPTVALDRARLHPAEATGVRVTLRDAAGRPIPGEAIWVTTADPSIARIEQPSGVTGPDGVFSTTVRVFTDAPPTTTTVVATSSGATGSSSLEVLQTTVIVHDPTGASTTVLALPHGDQDAVRDLENRGFAHSDLQPTGRWVRANDVLDVDVVDGPAGALALSFGARGPWQAFNGGQSLDVARVALTAGRQRVTAPCDGIVFVSNSSVEQVATVTIAGGGAHPVWVKDRTTPDDFAAQLSRFSTAPLVSIVGERSFVDVQRRVVDDLSSRGVAWDPADVAFRLDRVLSDTCDVYGLTYAAVGIALKYPGRAYFSGADSGAGWAFATNQWLSFQVDTGASETLLTTPDNWGTWHEVGHTFQTPAYTWSGLGEVTVNISSLALQQRLTGEHRLDQSTDAQDRISRYFAQQVSDRNFATLTGEDPFLPLFLFDQLRQSFGEGFYPAVSQVYRVRRIRGLAMLSTDQDKKDLFAQVASQVADRDLGPFFTAWGVPVSASVSSALGSLPALQNHIWTAIDSRDSRRERDVGYNLPVGVLTTADVTLSLGDRDAVAATVSGLSTLDGSASSVVARESVAVNVGPREGRVLAVLQASDATQEVLWHAVPVTVTSALEFVGWYDKIAGWIGMSADGTRLVATSTGAPPHEVYFRGKSYYQVTLQNASRRVIATVTVNGDETHDKVVAVMNGVRVASGYRLIVNAAEPSRVHVYQNSAQVGSLSSAPQTVTIRNGLFVIR